MRIQYRQAFLKDLKKLKGTGAYGQIKTLAFETLPNAETLQEIPNVKKLQGYSNRYRIRVGDYRVGIEVSADSVELVRVLHRKEFYRYFP